MTDSSRTNATIYPDEPIAESGAALLSAVPIQLESVSKTNKDNLRDIMEKNIEKWPCPEGLSREDLLLVHSRVMTAEWVMMRFKMKQDAISQELKITIDRGNVEPTTFPASTQSDCAIEQGVDCFALPSNSRKERPRGQKPVRALAERNIILTSHCVFIGVFQLDATSRQIRIVDTASDLVLVSVPIQHGSRANIEGLDQDDKI